MSSPTPQWRCPAGTVVGWADGPANAHAESPADTSSSPTVWRATGIPYARAERYRPPHAEPDAVVPLEATHWSPACPQRQLYIMEGAAPADFMGTLQQSEDCLRLSVTVPAGTAPDERLPVMVWIHGGSYVAGAGDQPIYDTRTLVTEQQVITVNVTYRLGMFGFLGREDVPANLGLLDLIEALRWVRRNIAAFGGDPDHVTAWGESAGADAVAHLMIAEGAEGLFQRGIIQSAPFGLMRGRAAMTTALGRMAAEIPADAPAQELLEAQERIERAALRFGLRGAMPFGPQYGQHPLPGARRLDTAWAEAARRVDVLVGWNQREAALFTPSVQGIRRLPQLPVVGRSAHEALVRLMTDRVYGAGAREFLRRHAAARGHGYRYLIHAHGKDNPLSSAHAAELPMLFWTDRVWGPARSLRGFDPADLGRWGRQMRTEWAGFARTGRIETETVPGLMTVAGAEAA